MKRFVIQEHDNPHAHAIGYGVEFEDGKIIYRTPQPAGDDMTRHSTAVHLASFLHDSLGPDAARKVAVKYEDPSGATRSLAEAVTDAMPHCLRRSIAA